MRGHRPGRLTQLVEKIGWEFQEQRFGAIFEVGLANRRCRCGRYCGMFS